MPISLDIAKPRRRKFITLGEPEYEKIATPTDFFNLDNEHDLAEYLLTEPGFIAGFTSVNGEPTQLYDYQVQNMLDHTEFKITNKGRQIGESFCFAAQGLARSQTRRSYKSVFISINQEEANEKIDFARQLYQSIPKDHRRHCLTDRKACLEFEIPGGGKTVLISFPQREPRGKGGDTDVFLDEIAHYTWARQIYTGAVPLTTRGTGTLQVASTPLGEKDLFYEILQNAGGRYSRYKRFKIHWWDCIELCINVAEARTNAPNMPTDERVYTYGTEKLQIIYDSLPELDFRQEYELEFVDEKVSYYPLDLIKSCLFPMDEEDFESHDEIEVEKRRRYVMEDKYLDVNFGFFTSIVKLRKSIQQGVVSPNLIAGFDVGRKRHTSELVILEKVDDLLILRFREHFDNVPYPEQRARIEAYLNNLPVKKIGIDATGIGDSLTEELECNVTQEVIGIKFTNPWKERVCTEFLIRLEDKALALPDDSDVVKQIHSIKRKVSEFGNVQYSAHDQTEHHADIFWAIACAMWVGDDYIRARPVIRGNFGNDSPGDIDDRTETRTFKSKENRIFKSQPLIHSNNDINFGLDPNISSFNDFQNL